MMEHRVFKAFERDFETQMEAEMKVGTTTHPRKALKAYTNSARIITVTGPLDNTVAQIGQPYENKRFKGVVCRPL